MFCARCPISYSALFADDLRTFKNPGHIQNIIKSYLESLVSLLCKWRLKRGKYLNNLDLFPILNEKTIDYNPNPAFLDIMFDEPLRFKPHVLNLRTRKTRIFSHNFLTSILALE